MSDVTERARAWLREHTDACVCGAFGGPVVRDLLAEVERLTAELVECESPALTEQRLERRIEELRARVEALRSGLETLATGECPRCIRHKLASNLLAADDRSAKVSGLIDETLTTHEATMRKLAAAPVELLRGTGIMTTGTFRRAPEPPACTCGAPPWATCAYVHEGLCPKHDPDHHCTRSCADTATTEPPAPHILDAYNRCSGCGEVGPPPYSNCAPPEPPACTCGCTPECLIHHGAHATDCPARKGEP